MFKKFSILSTLALWSASGLMADFTYQQSSKITGGAIAGMMKVAGAFSKTAREPQISTISIKGDRMLTRHADTAQVIDLNSETITDINFKNKTYSTITFAQMAEALQEASRKLRETRAKDKDAANADLKFSASVKETGQTKQIQGMDARQTILKLDMEGTDKKSGEKGAMQVVADMWLASTVAGYGEVRDFYQKMGQKLAWTPGGMGALAAASQPGMAEGMTELFQQASKLEGVPVLQITRMGVVAEGQDLSSLPAEQQTEGPTAKEAVGGALSGALGGFGRFGRKKKQQQEQAAPPQQQGGGLLMELTTELTSFSDATVDGSQFEIPAGFKQVESQMLKRMK